VAEVYWYWPGASNSGYKIHIDLARTRRAGDFYKFLLRFSECPRDEDERIRTTIAIPKNIEQLQNYPTPDAMQRVMRFDTIGNVAINGATDAHRIMALAQKHGFDPATGRVLDWGCGHGRVTRFLRAFSANGSLHGVDIDQTNIGWASENLIGINFRHGPLMPPLAFDSDYFDLVFGISVMTHLSRDVQRAWLEEIRRILAPGGLALLTFVGDSSVAFGSRYHEREWVQEYLRNGMGRDLPDKSLVGVIEDPSYYKNVKLTISKAKELCAEYMAVVAAHECMFGYQDLIIMKK
jgi:SAM-dependent methyltransferase